MLEGDLTDFTLPDVLRLLAVTGKTGRLTVDDGGRRGRLELRAGQVRDVSADLSRLPLARRLLGARLVTLDALREVLAGGGDLPGDLELARRLVDAGALDHATVAPLLTEQTTDAAFDLLRWSAGGFRFVGLDLEVPDDDLEPVLPVEELLEEVSARLEAWPQLVAETGAADAVVTLVRPAGEGPHHAEVSLEAAGWELLMLVDGRRTLAELVDLGGRGEYVTRRTLTELCRQGVVAIGAPGETGPIARRVQEHAALVELERATGQPPTPAAPPVRGVAPPAETVAPPPPATADLAPAEPSTPIAGQVRQLRTTVRGERLHSDPHLDEDLVTRLIEGVEAL